MTDRPSRPARFSTLMLLLALIAAVCVSGVLFSRYQQMGKEIRDTQALLSESRTIWETTAAEKEALQETRNQLRNDLKEASLSLTEAQERAKTLQEEIESLNQEIAELRENPDVSD